MAVLVAGCQPGGGSGAPVTTAPVAASTTPLPGVGSNQPSAGEASPTSTPIPSAVETPGASPSSSSAAIDLARIVSTPAGRRFETFGSSPIRLTRVWSGAEGLGGACSPSSPAIGWLECGLIDGLLHADPADQGPGLGLFVRPGSGVKIPSSAILPGAWVNVVGHFGDPAARRCAAARRGACRDRFVVDSFTVRPS